MQTITKTKAPRPGYWAIIGLVALLLAGCAAHPRNTPKERQQVVKEDLQKAGYMGRFMLLFGLVVMMARNLLAQKADHQISAYPVMCYYVHTM